jgi:glyoxylase-like metal-dependent hydrolase (beta-lactamase superfamily II)
MLHLYEAPLVRLTDHVWMYPPSPEKRMVQPSIGVVITPSQTVLYDAGNSPTHARLVQQALDAINAPPVRYVIYSHNHWDHIFGAQIFADMAEIVAHERCHQRVQELAARPWGRAHIQQVARERPTVRTVYEHLERLMDGEWEAFSIIPPTLVFDEPIFTLYLDGITLEIEHVGGAHSDDSTVMRVVEEKALFMADSFYPPMGGKTSDLPMMQRFLDEGSAVYVDGHNGRIWTGKPIYAP